MHTDKRKEVFNEALHFRHAAASFDKARPIRDSDKDFILEAGRLAPSSFGLEPWSLCILNNESIRHAIFPYTWGGQAHLETSPLFVLIKAKKGSILRPPSPYIDDLFTRAKDIPLSAQARLNELLDTFIKSDFAFKNDDFITEWSIRQTYILLSNMMMAAAFIGIDSCPIEGFDLAKVSHILENSGVIDQETEALACMVAFGYRAAEPKRPKTRWPLAELVRVV